MRIHHIGYLARNLENTKQEFLKLGFTIEKNTIYDSIRKINIIILSNEHYCVELIQPKDKESPLYSLLKKYQNTAYHFCYITSKISIDIKRFEEHGYKLIQYPQKAVCFEDKLVAFLMHPDMGIIELVEEK